MGVKRIEVKCTVCKKTAALIGDDIDRAYTVAFYEAQGWKFSKYKTMCPKCFEEESKKFQQVVMDL